MEMPREESLGDMKSMLDLSSWHGVLASCCFVSFTVCLVCEVDLIQSPDQCGGL
jgi:hypothetical protein